MADCALLKQSNGRYKLSGDLSFKTAGAVLRDSKNLFGNNQEIVVDLAEVKQADSAGLALVVEWLAQAKRSNTALCFQNIPQQMLSIARTSDLDKLLPECSGDQQRSEENQAKKPDPDASRR